METPPKLLIIGALASAIAGAAVDRYFNSREVVKTVTVDHDVIQYKIVTQTHEVIAPDGSKVIDSTVTDNTTEQKSIIQTIVDKKAAEQPQWLVAAGAGLNANRVRIYSLSVDRKILGPVSIGAYGATDSELGLRLGVSF